MKKIITDGEFNSYNLLRKTSFFKDACENANDLIQCVDNQGKFIYVNRKWVKTLGYSRGEIHTLHLNEILCKDQEHKCSGLLKRVCSGETIEDVEAIFIGKSGNKISVQGNIRPSYHDGDTVMVLGIFHEVKLRKIDEEALLKGEEKYRLISENTSDLIAILDFHGNYIYLSPSHRQLGYDPDEYAGKSGISMVHPADKCILVPQMLKYAKAKLSVLLKLRKRQTTEHFKFRFPDKSGKWHYLESTANLIENPVGKGYAILLISRDISERCRAESALKESEERYRDLVEKAGIAMVINDCAGNFKYYNKKFPELFGYTDNEMKHKSMASLIHPDDIERVLSFYNARLESRTAPGNYEFKGAKKDGSIIQLEVNATVLREGEKIVGSRAYLWDITDRKHEEDELRAISLIDPLTGLYNRRGFFALVKQQISVSDRNLKGFYIFFADLDKMKWINDRFGHYEGDNALMAAADVLKMSFRKSDILSRFGGDEFAVCAIEANLDCADIMIIRIQKNLRDLNHVHGKPYRLALSIGVAYYDPQIPCSIDDLLEKADVTMYKQKKIKNIMYHE